MEDERPPEIKPQHLARKAVVYERVSSPYQVENHKGSIEYQRSQSRYAEKWGWPPSAIEHIDEDLGRSGTSTQKRTGYQRLAEDIRKGLVGIVLTSDVSRVGREAVESFMLINECLANDTLLALDGRVYDVRESGHMLLLRLVSVLAEHDNTTRAEHSRRGRLGKLSKGISVSRPPIGYIRDKQSGAFDFDPSEEVQGAIHQLFSTFLEQRNIRKTVSALRARGIELPVRERGVIVWRMASRTRVTAVLTNEVYAGTYVYGRTRFDRRTGKCRPADPQNIVRVVNHHEGYVTRQIWEEVQRILESNRSTRDHTSAGNGRSVLQGLARCALHNNRALAALYPRGRSALKARNAYLCRTEDAGERCKSVSAKKLDDVVLKEVFQRLSPAGIDGLRHALKFALESFAGSRRRLQRQLEDVRRRAENLKNRVLTIDPDHRLARNKLEGEYESVLATEKSLELTLREEEKKVPIGLDCVDELASFSSSVQNIFWAPTTGNADRKELLRAVIKAVVVDEWGSDSVRARIIWKIDGTETPVEVRRWEYFRQQVRSLTANGLDPSQVAQEMNRCGLRNKLGWPWNREGVLRVLTGGLIGRTREFRERQIRVGELRRRAHGIILEMAVQGIREARSLAS